MAALRDRVHIPIRWVYIIIFMARAGGRHKQWSSKAESLGVASIDFEYGGLEAMLAGGGRSVQFLPLTG